MFEDDDDDDEEDDTDAAQQSPFAAKPASQNTAAPKPLKSTVLRESPVSADSPATKTAKPVSSLFQASAFAGMDMDDLFDDDDDD
jgi:hypothetical protein